MAYDKVVDSGQLNAALTATANAIREKAGNSDACPWDESTGFASLIAAIQAGGGGGGSENIKFAAGSFSVSTDTRDYYSDVTYDQIKEMFGGTMPDTIYAGYFIDLDTIKEKTATHALNRLYPSFLSGTPHYYNGSSHTRGSATRVADFDEKTSVNLHAYNATYGFMAGKIYWWFVIGV